MRLKLFLLAVVLFSCTYAVGEEPDAARLRQASIARWLNHHVDRLIYWRRPTVKAVKALRARGAHVIYDYQYPRPDPLLNPVKLLLGEDYFGYVRSVRMDDGACSADVVHLAPFKQLRWLNLRGELQDEDLQVISQLTKLEEIDFWGSTVSDRGIENLATGELTELRSLGLAETLISDDALPKLAKFKKLRYVPVFSTIVSEAGAAELRRALPECKVQTAPHFALVVRFRMPDGRLLNQYPGRFEIKSSANGRSSAMSAGKLLPLHLSFNDMFVDNGVVTISLRLDDRLYGSIDVGVKDGVPDAPFYEILLREE